MILELSYLSICCGCVVCLSTVLYNLIRQYCYVTVNCWFCNTNFRIPFKSRNEWFCMECQQFNGFKEDGDYSKFLPEQFDETFNQKYVRPSSSQTKYIFSSNGLCSICNANEELKIRQLALYVPFREENYDEEIEIFRNKLEKSYKLCENCENFVSRKLRPTSKTEYSFAHQTKIDENATAHRTLFKKYLTKPSLRVIFMAVIGFIAAFIFKKTKSSGTPTTDTSTNCSFEQYFVRVTSQLCCGFLLDFTFALSSAFLPYIFLNSMHSVVGILLVLFTSMINDDLIPFWKLSTISTMTIAVIIRYITNERMKMRCTLQKLNYNLQNRLILPEYNEKKEDECERNPGATKLNSSAGAYGNAPLCGKFSDMSLGKCKKCVSHSKGDRLLVQPSKLKLDECDYMEKLRTSPSASSGYESFCGGFFNRNAESVSEFDSISQVNFATSNNHLLSNISKIHSLRPTTQPVHFRSTDSPSLFNTERYYGAMPIHSPATMSSSLSPDFSNDKSQSQLQVNASIPTCHIILYSILFFILGFTFQVFVREFFF